MMLSKTTVVFKLYRIIQFISYFILESGKTYFSLSSKEYLLVFLGPLSFAFFDILLKTSNSNLQFSLSLFKYIWTDMTTALHLLFKDKLFVQIFKSNSILDNSGNIFSTSPFSNKFMISINFILFTLSGLAELNTKNLEGPNDTSLVFFFYFLCFLILRTHVVICYSLSFSVILCLSASTFYSCWKCVFLSVLEKEDLS